MADSGDALSFTPPPPASGGTPEPSAPSPAGRQPTFSLETLSSFKQKSEEPPKKIWLQAWNDPVAGVAALSPCVHTCDLYGDGDWRLIIADDCKKLKVWKGTTPQSPESALLDHPIAITSFYADHSKPKIPSLAVAAGRHVYIYRNLRPYYKFTLNPEETSDEEKAVWNSMKSEEIGPDEILAKLRALGAASQRVACILALSRSAESVRLAKATLHTALQPTMVTCLTTIKTKEDEPDGVGTVVLGSENGRVAILDNTGTQVVHGLWLPSAPSFIAVTGLKDVDYKLVVACRDSKLYIFNNSQLAPRTIELESVTCGLVATPSAIIVGTMSNVLHWYTYEGRKLSSVYMQSRILTVVPMTIVQQNTVHGVGVALGCNEIRIYADRKLLQKETFPAPIHGMCFGRYGRENNTLITTLVSGALDIKILSRTADLVKSGSAYAGPPPEQDVPLDIPKKTRLYVEQTQREREQAVDMHRVFQRDLCKVRLQTARAYVKVLTDGQGPMSYTSGSNLRLSAGVQGLGPNFRIKLQIQNAGAKPIMDVPVLLMHNETRYTCSPKQWHVPCLVPTVQYTYEVDVTCLDPGSGIADSVRIVLINQDSCLPILNALVKLPASELEEE